MYWKYFFVNLEVLENGVYPRDCNLSKVLLVFRVRDSPIIDNHGISTIAIAYPSLPAMGLGEMCLCITQEKL